MNATVAIRMASLLPAAAATIGRDTIRYAMPRKPSRGTPTKPSRPGPNPKRSPLKDFCRSLTATTEDVKWGDNHCFSVGGKLYAGFDLDDEKTYAFLCDDEDFDRLTERPGIIPAPYSARFGWVRVTAPALSLAEASAQLTKAHALAAAKLSKKKQRELGLLDD
jgi:predicted DNA-binding protein (MmcQ/YjbR family)